MKEGNDGGYMTHQRAKYQSLTNAPKMMIFFLIHINLMGELQCIFNPSKVIKPLNFHYSQLYNTYYVNNLKYVFQIKGQCYH